MLAAGRGQRMGADQTPKLLLPLRDGAPILAHAIRNLAALEPMEMIVVVRPDLNELSEAAMEAGKAKPTLNLRCVPNPRFAEGMGTSLAVGVAALSEGAKAVLVTLGDMPFVASGIIETLLTAYAREGKSITMPMYGRAVGPPTIFDRSAFPDLMKLEGEAGGRQLLALYPNQACLVQFL